MKQYFVPFALASSLFAGMGLTTAQATVIGAEAETDFSQNPTIISFGDGAAEYTLSQELQFPAFGPGGGVTEAVTTDGTARVARSTVNTGDAAAFADGVTLGSGQTINNTYVSFSGPAFAGLDDRTPYLALQFELNDGIHYGYAKANGSMLSSFAYESQVGESIVTGAAIAQTIGDNDGTTDVPEPSTWALFGLALGLVGLGRFRRQTLKPAE